jgi:hypothetical protein
VEERGKREEMGKREERREMRADRWGLTATWVPCHQNCFMAKYVWFWELYGKKHMILKFDGQNKTKSKVPWSKVDFFQ